MESRIDDWLAAEAAQRARFEAGTGPGVTAPAMALGMDGLSLMQAMLRGETPFPHIANTMDFLMIEVSHGRAVFQGTPGVAHLNPMGVVHGGWFATLLDSALGHPLNLLAYADPSEPPDFAALAASYTLGLAKNHAFVDGNKRAAFLATGLFLYLNGYRLSVSQAEATITMLAVASSEMSEDGYAAWLRAHASLRTP